MPEKTLMNSRFTASVEPPDSLEEPAYWFIFQGTRLLVHLDDEDSARLPCIFDPAEMGFTLIRQQYLGILENDKRIHCYSAEVAEDNELNEGMAFRGLRQLYTRLDDECFWLAGRAIQIVDWDRTHQYCSRCGVHTETMAHERAKKCPQCGFTSYPRLSPAIIVSVERNGINGPELLLARSIRHPAGLYSVLAGFVEPGETLEECVRREIREEVGLEVKNIRYFGSQPWPFPNSLMLAFTAEYAGGEIVLEEAEMAEAGWFPPHALPQVPSPISISRQLIDAFVRRHSRPAE